MLVNRLHLLRCLKASLPRLPVLFKPQRSFTLDSTPILKQTSDSLEVTASVSGKPVSGKFHYVWLRDHCPCPLCVHEHNRQKLHSSADVNVDVTPQSIRLLPSEASVEIVWPQHSLRSQPGAGNHVSQIPIKWLLEHSYQKSLASFKPAASKPVLWTAKDYEEKGVRVHYDDYMNTTSGLLKVLEQLRDYGLAFLTTSLTMISMTA
ncbi:hypothetical protein BC829DRAFT_159954 [Chytridium lagenaria]|nr:hypothetical protein BC829DRAFT_159954 [Chytridium lagenaria]